VDGDSKKMVFGALQAPAGEEAAASTDIKEKVAELCDNLKNPFFNIFHWVKGEINDIESVI